jgi:hypothetical protein
VLSLLAQQGKLGDAGRHQSAFAQICGTRVKNVQRWLAGTHPQRDQWATARNGLSKKGVDEAVLALIEEALHSGKRGPQDTGPFSSPSSSNTTFYVEHLNPLPKLCYLALAVPEQASSPNDFVVTGELRFSLASDRIGKRQVDIGLRRAVLLPHTAHCYIQPGSLYRPLGSHGAGHIVLEADKSDRSAVLEEDQLKGATLARLIAADDSTDPPVAEFKVQLEAASDLFVRLKGDFSGRSISQEKLAGRWIAQQLSKTFQDEDGSLRVSTCRIHRK